jgi:DNA polymerase III delta prime subunit
MLTELNQMEVTSHNVPLIPLFNLCPSNRHALIAGPPQSGKTTLAFNLAREMAINATSSELVGDVWYICSKSNIENYSPVCLLSSSVHSSKFGEGNELNRIQMKYLQSISDLNWWLLHIQELFQTTSACSPPLSIFIDDFDVFIDATTEDFSSVDKVQKSILHTIALLNLAGDFLNTKNTAGQNAGGGGGGYRSSIVLCVNSNSKWYNEVKSILARGFNNNVVITLRSSQGESHDYFLNEHKVTADT